MDYILANGEKLTVGREEHTGFLVFFLPESGGQLPACISGKFTSHKYLDEAWRVYENTAEDLRTRQTLAQVRATKEEEEDTSAFNTNEATTEAA